jgi:hypothetical protein
MKKSIVVLLFVIISAFSGYKTFSYFLHNELRAAQADYPKDIAKYPMLYKNYSQEEYVKEFIRISDAFVYSFGIWFVWIALVCLIMYLLRDLFKNPGEDNEYGLVPYYVSLIFPWLCMIFLLVFLTKSDYAIAQWILQ